VRAWLKRLTFGKQTVNPVTLLEEKMSTADQTETDVSTKFVWTQLSEWFQDTSPMAIFFPS
jgi:hypothetical protein